MHNTEAMTTRRSAHDTWMDLPARDREAWNNFRKAAGEVFAQVDGDLQQHLNVGYTDIDALLHLSLAEKRLFAVERG